ncbi:MAG TPA: hypothetical protein ENG32_00020 [bacterium]|nr:hypothetical protein [bacterium]
MISSIDFFFMLLLAIGADVCEVIGGFSLGIPGLGIIVWFGVYLIGLIISFILNLWIFLKGARIFWMIALSIVDLLSGGVLPARTLGVIVTYLLSKSKLPILGGRRKIFSFKRK